jgi:hypothetical protein
VDAGWDAAACMHRCRCVGMLGGWQCATMPACSALNQGVDPAVSNSHSTAERVEQLANTEVTAKRMSARSVNLRQAGRVVTLLSVEG